MTDSDYGFRSLAAWQKSQDLGVQVIEELRKLPREQGAASLSSQLVRSVGSISANIAEGYGRYSEGAYRNHLSIARGSPFETESWTDLQQPGQRRLKEESASYLIDTNTTRAVDE